MRQRLAHLDADQEHFILLALDTRIVITGYKIASSGGMAGTVVDPRIVFRSALLLGAASILVAHNHPSGAATPRAEDGTEELGDVIFVAARDVVLVHRERAEHIARALIGRAGWWRRKKFWPYPPERQPRRHA